MIDGCGTGEIFKTMFYKQIVVCQWIFECLVILSCLRGSEFRISSHNVRVLFCFVLTVFCKKNLAIWLHIIVASSAMFSSTIISSWNDCTWMHPLPGCDQNINQCLDIAANTNISFRFELNYIIYYRLGLYLYYMKLSHSNV